MSNGLQKLISKVDNCSTTTCAETLSKLGNSADIIASTTLYDSVPTIGSLPTAACNTGRFMAITGGSEVCYRYSDGTSWTNDYTSTQIATRTLWTWGDNCYGQLGNGVGGYACKSTSPITTCGGGTTWCQLSTGTSHKLAIKTDGTLWAFGGGSCGQLGTGNTTDYSSPVTTAGGGTTWKQAAAGSYHSAAIKTDGTLWTWGDSSLLGVDDFVSYSSPVTTAGGGANWCQVSASYSHSFAIKTDGTLWGWGYNNECQMGDGTYFAAFSPVTTLGGGTNWCFVNAGDANTFAIKTDGTLWAWGANYYGDLGDGTADKQSSPITVAGGGTNWCYISKKCSAAVAIKTDGTLWVWGNNSWGQLGTNNQTQYSSPVTIAGGGTTWCQSGTGGNHSGAVKTDGTLWTWGYNANGQLGTGNTTDRSSPVSALGGNSWCYYSAGRFDSAAIKYTVSKGF